MKVVEQARAMERLLANEDFMQVIMGAYIHDGISMNVLYGGVKNEGVQDELLSRQNLHSFIFDTISQGEILLEQNRE